MDIIGVHITPDKSNLCAQSRNFLDWGSKFLKLYLLVFKLKLAPIMMLTESKSYLEKTYDASMAMTLAEKSFGKPTPDRYGKLKYDIDCDWKL